MLEPTIIQQIESDPSVNSKSDVIQRGNISQFNGIEAVLFSQSIFRTTNSDNPLFGYVVIKNGMDLQSRPVSVLENAQKRNQASRREAHIKSQVANLGSSLAKGRVHPICI